MVYAKCMAELAQQEREGQAHSLRDAHLWETVTVQQISTPFLREA